MNEFKMLFKEQEISFDLEKYNQLYIEDYFTFFKIIMRFKEFENLKFDEYLAEKYTGATYFQNQKLSKKNLVVVDLNDFAKIISNLSFDKSSLLRKIYIEKFNLNIQENELEDLYLSVERLFGIDDIINFKHKDPSREKIIDLFLSMYIDESDSYLKNPSKIVDIIIEYLDFNDSMQAIIIIDSSLKAFDFIKLVDDERIIVIDTSIDMNPMSDNYLFIKDNEVETIKLENLVSRVELNWPIPIAPEQINTLLKTYLKIILNDELYYFDRPSSNLLILYIIVRNSLGLELGKFSGEIDKNSDEENAFIIENLL